jgi:hypothetical protein
LIKIQVKLSWVCLFVDVFEKDTSIQQIQAPKCSFYASINKLGLRDGPTYRDFQRTKERVWQPPPRHPTLLPNTCFFTRSGLSNNNGSKIRD